MGGGGSHAQALLSDYFQYTLDVFDYIIVPESYYFESVGSQTSISMHVVVCIYRMLTTVKLNYNSLVKRDKVYDVCFDGLLSAELDTFKLTVA